MNVLCPNCQKLLTVPDQDAGQTMKCPLCNGPFTVPALPQAGQAFSAAAPAAPSGMPPPSYSAGATPAREDTYSLAAEPPPPPPRRREEGLRLDDGPAPPPRSPAAERSPPPSPAPGYAHTRTLRLSPQVVPWIAPVCLLLLFGLLFFPWLGMYPGGVQVYSQTGWGIAFGGFWSNPVWEKVDGFASEQNPPGVSVPMIFYVLVLLLLGLPVAVLSVLMHVAPQTLPPTVQRFKPWRLTGVAGVVLLTTVLLVLQLLLGSSLEKTLQGMATNQVEKELERARTPEEKETVDLKRAQFLSQFNLRTTPWLRLAVYGHLIALAGVGLDFWLQRRGTRPPPRLEVSW